MTYSSQESHIIFTLREAEVSWKAIGQAIGKQPAAVKKYWQRNAALRGLPEKPKLSNSKTDGRVGLIIKKIVSENPKMSIADITYELNQRYEALGLDTSELPKRSTIHEFLRKNQIVVVRLLKKPLLRLANQEKRLNFARQALATPNLLAKLVHQTIWSDETTVRSHPSNKEVLFRCHSSVKKEDLPVNPQLQGGGFSVMFWGCFSSQGLGPLVALEGMQNQHSYIELLKEHLVPEIQAAEANFGISMTFMQDNAPCHKTNLVAEFLKKKKIKTLDWPPQSPDLNPIENLWAYIKLIHKKKFARPTSKAMLVDQIFQIWDALEVDKITNFTQSIENRLKECVRREGGITSY
jgi:transposase